MADSFKRINLCFDMNRREDTKVYNLLQGKRNKTAYVVEVILDSLEDKNPGWNRETLKEVLKEALSEINIPVSKDKEIKTLNEGEIPDDILDIISNI
ncbi:hypothetical protein BD780_003497 [Clostridium tetanomorphum]|uniref:hypothetical protein n=1 Tax=Clostridium tetanomorphum TaxID=1553 RepID=UPI000451CA7E|nr:hypothetical protein [Clostridium tetanomorphum]KAJ49376.1 hypothetical protein CTM_23449 [Clostridium tetanomorphum DSM 665]KAJ51215.1 hypothetical protein CTM_13883 [Clostridium tetanomorphum DSM 665]MBP1863696.1 hypothetical protein [Clostridium tetanomorphum]NRS86272.1 hypothetical protein [Clostridium tetanomorphum]SQC00720.1 Uncharacterised protein [Clostridium tetanomorphum]